MSGTQTGAVPIKQLIPDNVQSTVEQQALVSVYIKMGPPLSAKAVTSHDSPSVAVCILSVRYKVPSPVLPAVVVCCVVSGAPSNKALGSEELGSTWVFYPAETSAAHVV